MKHQLKIGAILSYLNIAANILLGLIVTPIIIHGLGEAQYGVYTLIGSLVSYLVAFDLGLNNAVIRYIALYRAQGNKEKEENFIAIVLMIFCLITFVIVILGIIFYYNLERLYGTTFSAEQLEMAKIMLIVLILNVLITVPGGAFTAICNGYEEFVFPRAARLIHYLLRSALVVAIMHSGSNAIGLVILDTVLNLLLIVGSLYYVFSRLSVRVKLHEYDWKYAKSILGYSIWIFLFALIYQIQWRSGQVILGLNYDPTIVGIYGVGVLLGLYFTSFGNVINGLLLPKAVQSVHHNQTTEELTDMTIRFGRISLLLCLLVFGGFILFGREFIHLWVGETYTPAWFVAMLIMAVYLLPISQGYSHALLEATKKVRFKALASLFFSLFGTIVGGLMSLKYGLQGMILGIFLCLLLLQMVMTGYYHRVLEVNMFKFFSKAVFPSTLIFMVSLWVGSQANSILDYGWLSLLGKILFYSLIFIFMACIYIFRVNLNNWRRTASLMR